MFRLNILLNYTQDSHLPGDTDQTTHYPNSSAGNPVVERKFCGLQGPPCYLEISRALVAGAAVVAIGMDPCEYSVCYKRDSLETPHRS